MRIYFFSICFFQCIFLFGQDAWKIKADKIDPGNYYGVTVANGMIGIVSSPEPFKVKDVVLAGAYDLYGRGRVSNFLRSFNLLNMYLEVDGKRIDAKNTTNLQQELDMHMPVLLPLLIMVIRRLLAILIIPYAIYHLPF